MEHFCSPGCHSATRRHGFLSMGRLSFSSSASSSYGHFLAKALQGSHAWNCASTELESFWGLHFSFTALESWARGPPIAFETVWLTEPRRKETEIICKRNFRRNKMSAGEGFPWQLEGPRNQPSTSYSLATTTANLVMSLRRIAKHQTKHSPTSLPPRTPAPIITMA